MLFSSIIWVRDRIRFSVWLVRGYAHVFTLLPLSLPLCRCKQCHRCTSCSVMSATHRCRHFQLNATTSRYTAVVTHKSPAHTVGLTQLARWRWGSAAFLVLLSFHAWDLHFNGHRLFAIVSRPAGPQELSCCIQPWRLREITVAIICTLLIIFSLLAENVPKSVPFVHKAGNN